MPNTIEVQRYNLKGELVSRHEISITDAEWTAINQVDYLQFDVCGLLMPEFDVHNIHVRIAMQSYSKFATMGR